MSNILHVLQWKIQLLFYKAYPGFQSHLRIARVWQAAPHLSSSWALSLFQSMKVLLPWDDIWCFIKIVWNNHGLKNTACHSVYSADDIYMLTLYLNAKEIIPFNLVWLGLTHSYGLGIFWSAKYGVSWSLLKDHKHASFHHNIVNDLYDLSYGLFHAISHFIGLPLAQQLVRAVRW